MSKNLKPNENKNIDVPKHTLMLTYLHLANEQMEELSMYNEPEVTDGENKKVPNPLFEFHNKLEHHIENSECFIKMNFAGKFCLKCGIKVDGVLYCNKCDELLQGKEVKQIKIQRDFRKIKIGDKILSDQQ